MTAEVTWVRTHKAPECVICHSFGQSNHINKPNIKDWVYIPLTVGVGGKGYLPKNNSNFHRENTRPTEEEKLRVTSQKRWQKFLKTLPQLFPVNYIMTKIQVCHRTCCLLPSDASLLHTSFSRITSIRRLVMFLISFLSSYTCILTITDRIKVPNNTMGHVGQSWWDRRVIIL